MSKNEMISSIYNSILESNDVLMPQELKNRYDSFTDRVLDKAYPESDNFNRAWVELIGILYDCIENAFSVGFKSAIDLIK